ncbi:MAG: Sec-independent protein translocase protein TatB [Rhizomicrobium sp.]
MFDLFSWSHILILLAVALVVVGPKDLPRLINKAGKWAGKARNMANEFKKSFDDMARQSELDELRAEIEKLKVDDPVADLSQDLNHEVQRALNPVDTGEQAEVVAVPEAEPPPPSGEYEISPPPRSGEYEISEADGGAPQTPTPAKSQTAEP